MFQQYYTENISLIKIQKIEINFNIIQDAEDKGVLLKSKEFFCKEAICSRNSIDGFILLFWQNL